MLALHGPGTRHEARDVLATEHPGTPSPEGDPERRGILGGARRVRAHALEKVGELGADDARVAEGDGGRDEGHDLTIQGVRVAVDDPHGVRVSPRPGVAARAHGVERLLDPGLPPGERDPGRTGHGGY